MKVVLGLGILLLIVFLYTLCRAAGEADRKMEEYDSKRDTSKGGA